MKKHTSKEAYYERLKNLAEVNKTSIKESKTRNLGSLIDYKRAADGVAYGIVKENHNYYLKKAGTKTDPNVSDFAYIGGLENITGFQFKSLAEADKQRNMVFHNINEAIGLKPNKTGSKMILKEDAAGEEIDQAEEKLGALDAAQSAEEMDSNGEEEMAAGLESEPMGDAGAPEGGEMPVDGGDGAPEGGEEISTDSTEEIPTDGGEEEISVDSEEEIAPEDGEMPVDGGEGSPEGDEGEESLSDMQSKVGKLASEIKSSDLGKEELTWLLKTFVRGFIPNKDEKDNPEANKMLKIDDEDRHEVSDMILDVVSDEEKADLGDNVEKSEIQASMGEGECSECGGFGKYAESRGYGSPEAFMECDSEEQANVISGYANAHNDGMNDGDLKTVAIILTPEIIEKLKGDYGHDEYAEKVAPYTDSMNETSDEDKMAELKESWEGLKSAGKHIGSMIGGATKGIGQAIGQKASQVGQGIANKASQVGQAIGQKASQVGQGIGQAGQAVKQAGQGIKQAYYKGEVNPAVKSVESQAMALGKKIADLNATLSKSGQEPLNVKSILAILQNQIGASKPANIKSKINTAEGIDPSNVQVQPNMLKEDDDEIEGSEEKEIGFAPGSQSLGVATVKPEGAPTTGVDITIDPNKNVSISMNESKKRIVKEYFSGNYDDLNISNNQNASQGKYKYMIVTYSGEDITDKEIIYLNKPNLTTYDNDVPRTLGSNQALIQIDESKKNNAVISMNESERKLRKYIRTRLEEKAGIKKPSLNENKKSETLKKLDAVIDRQFKLYETVGKKR